MRARILATTFVAVALLAYVAVRAASSGALSPSALALEATLLAPCCFGGTLDVHDSDIARDLRAEIERRVHGGETTESIERDLVSRYGDRMRAMPNRGLFTAMMDLAIAGAVAAAGSVALLALRWRTEPRDPPPVTPAAPVVPGLDRQERDPYAERLDAELEALDV